MKWKKEHKVPNSKGRIPEIKNHESNSNDSQECLDDDDVDGAD